MARLQKDIRQHKAEEEQAGAESVEQRKRFIERSAQLRDAIRAGLLGPPGGEEEAAPPQMPEQDAPEAQEPEPPAFVAPSVPGLNLGLAGPSTGGSKQLLSKPKWALTEEDAEAQDALQEEVDIDDLLDFVENLDFEEYIDDFEVQQALEIMKSRVTNIDTHRSDDVGEDGEPRAAAQPVDVSKEAENWNAATKVRGPTHSAL